MTFKKIKSHAKINLALNIVGKSFSLHKIESIVAFISLHDDIFIKKIRSKRHDISFEGKFSKGINKKNTVFQLLEILDEKKLLQNQKFKIKVNKRVPSKSGLGGGSMNAANILKYFLDTRIIKTNKKEIIRICKLVSSDMILGLKSSNSILTAQEKIRYFTRCNKFYTLIVKPNFGCSTSQIYAMVKKFKKPQFNRPKKKMFEVNFLKKSGNCLEEIAFLKYPKLKSLKIFLKNLANPVFVRMTGSGSTLVAYYKSKKRCESAKKKFNSKYKNYWCISSKTI